MNLDILIFGKSHLWKYIENSLCPQYLRIFVRQLQLRTTVLLVFSFWLLNSVKLVSNKLVDHLEKFGLFLIASMVSGLLIHPYIFWQFYLREILGLLIGLGLFKLEHVIYIITNFDRVWYTDLFHKLKSSSKVPGFIWYFFNNRWLGFLLNANPYKNN